ncbi:MAG: hypothetical protein ACOYNF_19135 [Rhodoferax sp.]
MSTPDAADKRIISAAVAAAGAKSVAEMNRKSAEDDRRIQQAAYRGKLKTAIALGRTPPSRKQCTVQCIAPQT